MVIVETPICTRQVTERLTEQEYLEFQVALVKNERADLTAAQISQLRQIVERDYP